MTEGPLDHLWVERQDFIVGKALELKMDEVIHRGILRWFFQAAKADDQTQDLCLELILALESGCPLEWVLNHFGSRIRDPYYCWGDESVWQ